MHYGPNTEIKIKIKIKITIKIRIKRWGSDSAGPEFLEGALRLGDVKDPCER
jgi:hypothetical protein